MDIRLYNRLVPSQSKEDQRGSSSKMKAQLMPTVQVASLRIENQARSCSNPESQSSLANSPVVYRGQDMNKTYSLAIKPRSSKPKESAGILSFFAHALFKKDTVIDGVEWGNDIVNTNPKMGRGILRQVMKLPSRPSFSNNSKPATLSNAARSSVTTSNKIPNSYSMEEVGSVNHLNTDHQLTDRSPNRRKQRDRNSDHLIDIDNESQWRKASSKHRHHRRNHKSYHSHVHFAEPAIEKVEKNGISISEHLNQQSSCDVYEPFPGSSNLHSNPSTLRIPGPISQIQSSSVKKAPCSLRIERLQQPNILPSVHTIPTDAIFVDQIEALHFSECKPQTVSSYTKRHMNGTESTPYSIFLNESMGSGLPNNKDIELNYRHIAKTPNVDAELKINKETSVSNFVETSSPRSLWFGFTSEGNQSAIPDKMTIGETAAVSSVASSSGSAADLVAGHPSQGLTSSRSTSRHMDMIPLLGCTRA